MQRRFSWRLPSGNLRRMPEMKALASQIRHAFGRADTHYAFADAQASLAAQNPGGPHRYRMRQALSEAAGAERVAARLFHTGSPHAGAPSLTRHEHKPEGGKRAQRQAEAKAEASRPKRRAYLGDAPGLPTGAQLRDNILT